MNKPKIAVLGDFMLDHYFIGKTNRISPEAPIPVVEVVEENYKLGGAGNVCRNLVSFECQVWSFSALGNDSNAEVILNLLKEEGIETDSIILCNNRITTTKSRVQANNQQIVRIDKEIKIPIDKQTEDWLISEFKSKLDLFDLVIISDYDKGVVTERLAQSIIEVCSENNSRVLVDPKGKDFSKYRGAYLLTPNTNEASLATGVEIKASDLQSVKSALQKLSKITRSQEQIITLGADGIAYLNDTSVEIFPAVATEVYDVTGAGDTVIAALAYRLCSGLTIQEAIIFANKAAAVVIKKSGAAVTSLEEIEITGRKKIFENVNQFIQHFIQRDKKIVLTNGCFDILHRGHLTYLEKASLLGDILIVAINSDASVRKLKGLNRPINNQEDRSYMLAALRFVDYVIIFDEETPHNLISIIKPDILVKGGDYSPDQVIGSDLVKETIIMPLVEGKSTTGMIDRIIETFVLTFFCWVSQFNIATYSF